MKADDPIRKIMTTHLVTVNPETPVSKIKEIFDTHDFHHLPVVDKGEVLAGIISKEDFHRVSYLLSMQGQKRTSSSKPYDALAAENFMTEYPLTLDPEDTVGLAADIFLANKFHALPIIEDGVLIGMVTTHDLLAGCFASNEVEREEEEWEDSSY